MFKGRLDAIKLEHTLPAVFAGSDKDEHVAQSQVWKQQLMLTRGNDYLVEAESGTGKSSLCAFLYGNRHDYHGRILFNGENIRNFTIADWCEIRRRHLAYLPQEMRLFPELTAFDNIIIKNRLTDRFTASEIHRMLDRLDIGHKANVVAGRLSVGQQQRVAIIRALCQPFDFILLDEPVSHLDHRNNLVAAALIAEQAATNHAAIITTSVGNPLLLREIERGERNILSIKL